LTDFFDDYISKGTLKSYSFSLPLREYYLVIGLVEWTMGDIIGHALHITALVSIVVEKSSLKKKRKLFIS